MTDPALPRLRPLRIRGLEKDLDIPVDGLSIGRDPSNTLVLLGDEHPYISSHHARIEWKDSHLVLFDLKSKNGTTVNGESVTRRELKPGDRVQLGREVGVSFLVVAGHPNAETLELTAPAGDATAESEAPIDKMGQSTIIRFKKALARFEQGGSPDSKRRPWLVRTLGLIVLGALGTAVVLLFQQLQEQSGQIDELERTSARLDRSREEVLAETAAQLAIRQEAYLADKQATEARFEEAQEQLAKAQESQASQRQLLELRETLEGLENRVEAYKPIDLKAEAARQREILTRVVSAVAYIENHAVLREIGGDRYFHVDEVDGTRLRPRTEKSKLFVDAVESGSGFCVSKDGYLITNAHVIRTQTTDQPLDYRGIALEYALRLEVVFSGTSKRHPAELISVMEANDDEDYAVIKIKPFPKLPILEGFTIERPIPPAGTNLRLFGFPLGKRLPQDDDVMEASVFNGSVSRRVRGYFQVQSAVYPGNSGGPVVDSEGNVVGVVTAVQTVSGGQIASDIGYILPIGRMSKIWPPDAKLNPASSDPASTDPQPKPIGDPPGKQPSAKKSN